MEGDSDTGQRVVLNGWEKPLFCSFLAFVECFSWLQDGDGYNVRVYGPELN